MILAGQVSQHSGDSRAAANWYFHAAMFASDLGQGTFPMAVAGIATSKTALRVLARLIGSVQDDRTLLVYLKQELSKRENCTPSLNSALAWESAHAASALSDIERSYIARRSKLVGRILPWRAIGAWRLSRSMPLVLHLDGAARTADLAELRQLGRQINIEGGAGRGAVVYSLPDQWEPLILEIENLRQLTAAVQMAVPLQEWRLAHASYPAALPFGQVSATHNLRYQPSSDQHAYQFVSRTGAIVLDVNGGESQARAHKNQAVSSPR
jgi:hypothetical protein